MSLMARHPPKNSSSGGPPKNSYLNPSIAYRCTYLSDLTPRKLNSSSLKIGQNPKGKAIVFPSFFRGKLLNFGVSGLILEGDKANQSWQNPEAEAFPLPLPKSVQRTILPETTTAVCPWKLLKIDGWKMTTFLFWDPIGYQGISGRFRKGSFYYGFYTSQMVFCRISAIKTEWIWTKVLISFLIQLLRPHGGKNRHLNNQKDLTVESSAAFLRPPYDALKILCSPKMWWRVRFCLKPPYYITKVYESNSPP